ncbi:MAG TPA: GNAT family N-acetyltransferase [Candidatus Anaerofilum excrementigallinarum]|nr:GNAT family N-acetyltransferase [Candidatus Anaerofilum excrementigallinarum]
MILPVTRQNIHQAAVIHSESWKESHKDLCSAEFLEAHTPERQKSYLEAEMEQGAQIYMLVDQKPVGIISVQGCLIANLYVLPSEQNKGYGTRLLAFAVTKCQGPPSLWVLSSNQRAQKFYERNGFCPTGAVVQHTDTLWELEFRLV